MHHVVKAKVMLAKPVTIVILAGFSKSGGNKFLSAAIGKYQEGEEYDLV